MRKSRAVFFNFYGLRILVKSENANIRKDLLRDFSYFHSAPVEPRVVVEVIDDSGPRHDLPRLRASLETPRNTVYRDNELSYVDYFGRALMKYSGKEERYSVYCEDRDLAHEITYLTILSRVGKHLDTNGLHRVHALGV